jgi:arylsulfatase A-like enzyme
MKNYSPVLAKPAITLFSACLLTSCSGLKNESEQKDIRFRKLPNIVLISLDDSNNWLGAWGGQAITPNIDKLAAQGRMFYNAHCVAPVCNSSRTALLTGQRPETTGQWGNPGNFRDLPGGAERITLPQYLRAQGYEAVAAGKIFHNPRGSAEKPSPHSDDVSWDYQWVGEFGVPGWDNYYDDKGFVKWIKGKDIGSYPGSKQLEGFLKLQGFWGPVPYDTEECGDWQVMDFGVQYLEKEHDKPFFLALGTLMPHLPHLAPQKYFDMYPLDKIQFPYVPADEMDDIPADERTSLFTTILGLMKEMGEYEKAVQAYLASTSFADDCVGHFMNALDKSKYKDNTIVIFISDHGYKLGHKNRWAKGTLWNQSTHSPLAIRLPEGMIEPGVSTTPVSFLDVFPTIVDLLGLEKPSFIEGNSLMPLLINPASEWKHPAIVTNGPGNHSILYDKWNYIRYEHGAEELYNLAGDPDEHINLAADTAYRDIINRLSEWIPE